MYHLLHVFAPPANLISGWSQQRAKRASPSLVEEWAATGAVRATPTPVKGCFGGGGGLHGKGTWQFLILLIKNGKTPVVVLPPRWNECCGSSVRHPVEVLDALGEVLPVSVGVKVWQDVALPFVGRGAAGHAVGQAEAAELLKHACRVISVDGGRPRLGLKKQNLENDTLCVTFKDKIYTAFT